MILLLQWWVKWIWNTSNVDNEWKHVSVFYSYILYQTLEAQATTIVIYHSNYFFLTKTSSLRLVKFSNIVFVISAS
jgi:hypothetical protein